MTEPVLFEDATMPARMTVPCVVTTTPVRSSTADTKRGAAP